MSEKQTETSAGGQTWVHSKLALHSSSLERFQRGVFHAVEEALGLGLQPRLVDAPGAAHDSVHQSGVEASSLVTGQIDDDCDRPGRPRSATAAKCAHPPRVSLPRRAGQG
jgi:hypothetical protein